MILMMEAHNPFNKDYVKIQAISHQGFLMKKIFGFIFILFSSGIAVWYPLGKVLG